MLYRRRQHVTGCLLGRPLQKDLTIPKEWDGVSAAPAIGYGLEVCRIGIPLEDPLLGTSETPIGLLIRIDDRELILKIVTKHPLIRGQARRVGPEVEGLDVVEEGFLSFPQIPSKIRTPSPS